MDSGPSTWPGWLLAIKAAMRASPRSGKMRVATLVCVMRAPSKIYFPDQHNITLLQELGAKFLCCRQSPGPSLFLGNPWKIRGKGYVLPTSSQAGNSEPEAPVHTSLLIHPDPSSAEAILHENHCYCSARAAPACRRARRCPGAQPKDTGIEGSANVARPAKCGNLPSPPQELLLYRLLDHNVYAFE